MDIKEKSKRYHNPYGTGGRWTPVNEIHGIQPVITIAIRRMEIYHPMRIEEEREKVHNYLCRNSDLFERKGQYLVAIYLKETNVSIVCFTTAQVYSDILNSVNEKLDLCILFQRHSYPEAKPYYSKYFGGGWITPYLNNSITFCNKETSIGEMNDKMKNVFDPAFSEFTRIMGEGCVFNFSKEKLKIIDIVDKIYSPINNGTNISKPLFIKHVLDSIPDFEEFNDKPELEKEDYVRTCYIMAWTLPIMQTRSQEVEQILYSMDSDSQKIKRILDLLKEITL